MTIKLDDYNYHTFIEHLKRDKYFVLWGKLTPDQWEQVYEYATEYPPSAEELQTAYDEGYDSGWEEAKNESYLASSDAYDRGYDDGVTEERLMKANGI